MDAPIIETIARIAEARGVTMTEVALAWLLTKVTAPVVGATKPHHIDAPSPLATSRSPPEEISAIESPYAPHAVVGVVAENRSPSLA